MTTNVIHSRLTPTIHVQAMIIDSDSILAYNVSSDLHRDVPCASVHERTCLLVLSGPTNSTRSGRIFCTADESVERPSDFFMEMFWLKGFISGDLVHKRDATRVYQNHTDWWLSIADGRCRNLKTVEG